MLDATPFGRSAEGHCRVSFVVDEKSLTEACRRIASFTNELGYRMESSTLRGRSRVPEGPLPQGEGGGFSLLLGEMVFEGLAQGAPSP